MLKTMETNEQRANEETLFRKQNVSKLVWKNFCFQGSKILFNPATMRGKEETS